MKLLKIAILIVISSLIGYIFISPLLSSSDKRIKLNSNSSDVVSKIEGAKISEPKLHTKSKDGAEYIISAEEVIGDEDITFKKIAAEFDADDEKLFINAAEAFKKMNSDLVQIKGDVVLSDHKKLEIKTDEVFIDFKKKSGFGEHGISFVNNDISIEAKCFEIKTGASVFVFKKQVNVIIK